MPLPPFDGALYARNVMLQYYYPNRHTRLAGKISTRRDENINSDIIIIIVIVRAIVQDNIAVRLVYIIESSLEIAINSHFRIITIL